MYPQQSDGADFSISADAHSTFGRAASLYKVVPDRSATTLPDGSTDATASFASIATLADYLQNGYWAWAGGAARHWASNSITVNIDDLNAAEQTLAITALNLWHEVANVSFTFVSGAANITYNNNGTGQAVTNSSVSGGYLTSATIDISSDWAGGSTDINSYKFQTYIHETGHALGLGHQGPYNFTGTYGTDNIYTNDTWQWSIMSYFTQDNYGGASYDYVITPEMADIQAVQNMYGAATTRADATTYGFNSTAGSFYDFSSYTYAPAFTIYDSGGTDTLDASNYGYDQTIDLTPGDWSSIGGFVDNIGIWLNTTIENAVGGSGSDGILGNAAGNSLDGGAGNDTMKGGGGADFLVGGPGADSLDGGDDSDTAAYLDSGAGVKIKLAHGTGTGGDAAGDTLSHIENVVGSDFHDVLKGDGHDNTLKGAGGADTLTGGPGMDVLVGGDGIDTANYSGSGSAVLVNLDSGTGLGGDAAGDTLAEIENVKGSPFDDILQGDAHANTLNGLAGADTLKGAGGADHLIGGNGIDTASYQDSGSGVTVNLATGTGAGGDAAGDTLSDIENVVGTDFTDTLTGDGHNNTLGGGDGDDTLEGRHGADMLFGGDGIDTASYSGSVDGVNVSLASGTGTGGDAAGDTLSGIENLTGSNSADTLAGNAHANVLFGMAGKDVLKGGLGADELRGGFDADKLIGGKGADHFVYTAVNGSMPGGMDWIKGFSQVGSDKIDVSALDADSTTGGLQHFTFIGSDPFSGTAGELRFMNQHGNTYVQGDVNGDSVIDFLIKVGGNVTFTDGDFILS